MYNVHETEHQELFFQRVNPLKAIDIHIPSALGTLGYFIYVRVPYQVVFRLTDVSSRFDIDGFREDHLTVAPVEIFREEHLTESKRPELVWCCLGKANISRGNGQLQFNGWPEEVPVVDVLLCTWPRFVSSGQADDWIAAQQLPNWTPSGVPLGGIGGGRVDICCDGRFRNFSMNNNQDAPLEDPDGLENAYLAITVGGKTVDLASTPIVAGHEACQTLIFLPRFPQAKLTAPEIYPGLDVAVTFSGTLIPHDLDTSSIPGLLVQWKIVNHSSADLQIKCHLGWPNLIGIGGMVSGFESGIGYGDGYYQHWCDTTGQQTEAFFQGKIAAVRFSGKPVAEFLAADGEHILGILPAEGLKISTDCCTAKGQLAAEFTITATSTATITMGLVAAMPHWIDTFKIDRGHYWQRNFKNGAEMLAHLLKNADHIIKEAGALAELLEDSSLPAPLRSRLNNCNYPLVTNSVLYRDGRFSINEGPTEMAGCYGTIDQRLAAHPATQLLFPTLNKQELSEFAAIQGENGGIQHDLGAGHLERTPGDTMWPDLTCSFIIQTAKHAWMNGDTDFEKLMWPRAKRALMRHAEWAEEGKGVAQVGGGLGTSYDGYHYIGTTGYMATLWLAALAVAERWGARMNDNELQAKIPVWRRAALARLETDLWNGEHFIAYGNDQGVRRETCHAGQLAGQCYMRALTGQDVIPADKLLSCIDALMKYNGSENFALPADEVNPDGSSAVAFSWLPYVEGFMLSAVASRADTRLLPLWLRMIETVENNGKTPCDTRLMYRPEKGEPSWGSYYMTAPASWLVYEAMLDFRYLPETGLLRLRATIPGRYPLIHPLFWATVDIGNDHSVSLKIVRTFAEKSLQLAMLESDSGKSITMDGQLLHAQAGEGCYREHKLPEERLLFKGLTINWQENSNDI